MDVRFVENRRKTLPPVSFVLPTRHNRRNYKGSNMRGFISALHGLIVPEVQEADVTYRRKCRNLMASTAHVHD